MLAAPRSTATAAGGTINVNAVEVDMEPVSVLVTIIFAAPAVEVAEVVAKIEVLFTKVELANTPPIFTVVPVINPVPVIVKLVPPAVVLVAGEMPVIVGAEI